MEPSPGFGSVFLARIATPQLLDKDFVGSQLGRMSNQAVTVRLIQVKMSIVDRSLVNALDRSEAIRHKEPFFRLLALVASKLPVNFGIHF